MAHPIYLTRKTLMQHVLLHGATGSGKTSLVLMPMIERLIRLAADNQDSSIIVLDLKGDPANFHRAQEVARSKGLPFRWFTTMLRRSTFGMNPFLQKHFQTDLTRNQAAEMFAKAFGLDFGNQYGASYFRDMAVLVLRALLKLPEIDSFAQLSEYAQHHPEFFGLPKHTVEQTTHLRASLDALATIEPLNISRMWSSDIVLDQAIDIGQVLSEPQVLYFYLPSNLEDLICFTVAKLVCYLLLTAAAMRPAKERLKVFLCVDEVQRMVSPDLSIFVQQARSLDVGCILCSQTTSDLHMAGQDFAEILDENTITKIDFSGLGPKQVKRLKDQSPDGLMRLETASPSGGKGYNTQFVKSLTDDELTDMTARLGQGRIRVAMPHGLTQCGGRQVRYIAQHHLLSDHYDELVHREWPKACHHPGTVTVTGEAPPETLARQVKKRTKKIPRSPRLTEEPQISDVPAVDDPVEEEQQKEKPNKDSVFQRIARRILGKSKGDAQDQPEVES